MNKHRRGNPNWCSMGSVRENPPVSDWERMRKSLGLTEAEAIKSREMREWATKHRHNRYVPSSALQAWGMETITV